jgi:uncharacterized SAM-binding protein YcdF (DUF218 family)
MQRVEEAPAPPRRGWRLRLRRFIRLTFDLTLVWLIFVGILLPTIYVYGRIDRAQPADVIVVLGAGLRRDDRPGPALVRRSMAAADLYAQGLADRVICTGGVGARNNRSEADACAELLRGFGIPAAAILLEERSRSTEENAFYTRQIMEANGWSSAVLVSDAYHLLRAGWLFDEERITAYTSPAADPRRSFLVFALFREVLAMHWQLVKDLLGLPVTHVAIV